MFKPILFTATLLLTTIVATHNTEDTGVSIHKAQSEETARLIEMIDSSFEQPVPDSPTKAAKVFLSTLSPEDQHRVQLDFKEETVMNWDNAPLHEETRNGASFHELNAENIRAALQLIRSTQSEEGYKQLTDVMKADAFLHTDNTDDTLGAGLYSISIHGTPSDDDVWMLQFSGHHLAKNIVIHENVAHVTPQFLGVEPGQFTWWDGVTYEPLHDEKNSLQTLFDSLSEEQIDAAKLGELHEDIVLGPEKDNSFPEKMGIAYSALSAQQQELFKDVVTTWTAASPESETVNAYLEEVALNETTIAWSGHSDMNEPSAYARIDGPRVWLEWSAKEGASNASDPHFHTVWRDKQFDYAGEFVD
ncbi:hypothetical protein JCM19037_963 [Geomicrobium sp. JCM 19037]|uniref:DUF3500 domain-containing protein n=1 Tax=Geomicrobium sp. JCM 19037 TaxID=1460634 RepID=UPI00045F1CDD|nr:DUF3500 domain-containing protein [Geomicrobium sp. JCM 19037]GAK02710.1 hypothetical protein JCM19037_963 [Geomicrobium sp. JCM 19037]